MNKVGALALKALRKIYRKTVGEYSISKLECEEDANVAAKLIYDKLMDNKPSMIARFGSKELFCLVNYLGVKRDRREVLSFIQGKSPAWWWEEKKMREMHINAGFFPPTEKKLEQFCELMIGDIPLVDILGSWRANEIYFENELSNTVRINLELLNPYFSDKPWTKALAGKKVLVIHPFVKSMTKQYEKRRLIFKKDILPEFELITLKAVQSIAGQKTEYEDWFEALNFMKEEMSKLKFDVCLVGAGAYGFPLAAHAKRIGKKGFHMGGSLQLLFGIRGKRWENENYNEKFDYTKLMNEHWVRPSKDEKPTNAHKVENATYW